MQKIASWIYGVFTGILVITLVFGGYVESKGARAAEGGRKIVVFREGVSDAVRDQVLGKLNERRVKRLSVALSADVVQGLTEREVVSLLEDSRVLRVDDDVLVYALDLRDEFRGKIERRLDALSHTNVPIAIQAQSLPWGVDQVDAELVWPTGNTANPIKVGVIDTGLNLSHPDLKDNIKGGYNAIRSWKSAEDDNGHGSHVGGIIAAVSNTQGVVGVAHQADLYAIKVLNAAGSGYLSDIIEGIDWAISNGLDVINMSLGTTANIQSFHDAVIRAKNAGIVQVAAAGNSGGSVIYPAAYAEVIAVSATDSANNIASWSSRGPEVDLAAPGVSIYSTYKSKTYATLSGTSMAAPHVAGVVALMLNTAPGAYDTNSNSSWDPSEIEAKLEATATDLGAPGFDNLYGFGLVQADAATQ